VAGSVDVDDLAAALYDGIALAARRLRQVKAAGELSLPERAALSRLDRGGPATAAELARAEQISPQGMAVTLGPWKGKASWSAMVIHMTADGSSCH
jgi:hypothetical protein